MSGLKPDPNQHRQNILNAEHGWTRKKWKNRISVALIYPNTYSVGMSNLGMQAVYRLLNDMEDVVCERAFLPDTGREKVKPHHTDRIVSMESGRDLAKFDIIAFSISFENDYPHLLTILEKAGIPLLSDQRQSPRPLILAGGVTCFLNPEPIAPFMDCFLLGEAEAILPAFFRVYRPDKGKESMLQQLARRVPGVYVPRLYQPVYAKDGTLTSFEPEADIPQKVKRAFVKDITAHQTCSTVLTPHTTFEQTYLIEVGRGCARACRFCSAGFVYRPPRFRRAEHLMESIRAGSQITNQIGLVGTAVSDLPGLKDICTTDFKPALRLSFSSLRADALSTELLETLRQSGAKTATIAPDAGSEYMRKVINKGITEEDILSAAVNLVNAGIPNLKLYFMVGLPHETQDDVLAIVHLVKKIKHHFLKASRIRKHLGEITISLNCFVPKPFTPFQWAAMDTVSNLKKKIKSVRHGLKKVANVRVNSDVPRWAYIQALLSRGDRRVADLLLLAHANGGNWPRTFKESPLNADFYVHRERRRDELFPWDFIDHGLDKTFLAREYDRAGQGKTSPPCPMAACNICGVCEDTPHTD
jgi:radical SAM family uncharacterized protein